MSKLARIFRHLCAFPAARLFRAADLAQIGQHIAECERSHRGEIVFAVESDLAWRDLLAGTSARQRADIAFGQLRVWDTAANNGVLIYLLLADHRIEIVADRGLHGLVDAAQWREVCATLEARLAAGEAVAAVIAGIDAVSALLAAHFPQLEGSRDEDELANLPRILR